MLRIKSKREYEVECKNCNQTLIFDSPKDLTKKEKDNYALYCIVCPLCGQKIIVNEIIDSDFIKQSEAPIEDIKIEDLIKLVNDNIDM